MSKKWFVLAGVIGLAVFLMQCEYSSTSYGEWDEMIVLGDSAQVTDLSEDIENHFTFKRNMPVTETSFKLKFMPIEKLPRFERRKNLLLVGTLESVGATSIYLDKILPDNFKTKVRADGYAYTLQENLYTMEQNVLIFAAATADRLKEGIIALGPEITAQMSQRYRENIVNYLDRLPRNRESEEQMLDEHQFALQLRQDYFIARSKPEANFIWLRRFDQVAEISRDIAVKYYTQTDTISFTADWLLEQRQKMTTDDVLRTEIADTSNAVVKDVSFGNRYSAIKIEGAWRTEDYAIGGPFSLYGFFVPEQGRAYLIDVSVTAVGRRKTPIVMQMELVAESFFTKESLEK
jgi:hypothetical protein